MYSCTIVIYEEWLLKVVLNHGLIFSDDAEE